MPYTFDQPQLSGLGCIFGRNPRTGKCNNVIRDVAAPIIRNRIGLPEPGYGGPGRPPEPGPAAQEAPPGGLLGGVSPVVLIGGAALLVYALRK